MIDIYVAVLRVSSYGLFKETNRKIDPASVYREDGLEFQVLYCDDDYYQLKLYAENKSTARILFASCEKGGKRIGGKFDIPIWVENDEGIGSVRCGYILSVSRQPIYWNDFYQALEIAPDCMLTKNDYTALIQKLEHWERIFGFQEMLRYFRREPKFQHMASEMVKRTQLYDENFTSRLSPKKQGVIRFEENLTLLSAKEAVKNGKRTAILNFANPIEAGGGVFRGAKAQEENLCRSSNLYKSLSSENAKPFYENNQAIFSKNQFNSMFLGTDQVIYSPYVTVVKENPNYTPGALYYQNERYTDYFFSVDVITAAAPLFHNTGYLLPNGDLQHLLERRIKNILEAAIANGVETLVLGAFGCGAFHNPPKVVADAFRNVLLLPRYRYAFDEVVFAVKRSGEICPNIRAFQQNFAAFPSLYC